MGIHCVWIRFFFDIALVLGGIVALQVFIAFFDLLYKFPDLYLAFFFFSPMLSLLHL